MYDPLERSDDGVSDDAPGTGLLWRTARNTGLLLVGCLLVFGALSQGRDESASAPEPVRQGRQGAEAAIPYAGGSSGATDELVIPAGPDGHFMVDAAVGGVEIRFLVDTGASRVVLTREDAERLGFQPHLLDYSELYRTANGEVPGAPVVLPDLSIGELVIDDVRASVIQSPMVTSLLGMSVLGRLDGYEVRDEGLVLRW